LWPDTGAISTTECLWVLRRKWKDCQDVPRLEVKRAGKAGGWLSAPSVAGQGLCLAGANYCTLLKWHLRVPLLPADCAGRPCPLCDGPVDMFGDYSVSCKTSDFADRRRSVLSYFCDVFNQARIPHDYEVDVAGNGRRPGVILLKCGTGGGTSRWT